MSETAQDRRHFHRIIMHKPVQLHCPSGHQIAQLLDISLQGVLVSVSDSWQAQTGNQAQARINLGDEGNDYLIDLTGRVAHVENNLVGLEITSMDLDSATNLRRLVELNLADPSLLERELSQLTAT
jgi:hypothetical protein